MLEIKNLNKTSHNISILNDINMNVEEGMIYGFIGHNGAGKSTTMMSIVGLTSFDSGTIKINNQTYKHKVSVQQKLGYLPENPSFYNYLTGKEYIEYLTDLQKSTYNHEIFEKVGLQDACHKRIGTYSRGMKQRLGMAAAIIGEPKLLILDEPTSALDPKGRFELFSLIKEVREQGSTVILSTHILDDIEKISDRIGIIKQGKVIKEGNVETILSTYFKPIYDIELGENCDMTDINELKRMNWISDVVCDKKSLSVMVTDIDEARKQMLKLLASTKLNVMGFKLRKPSLDEIFLSEVSL